MSEEHPRRDVVVEGAVARAVIKALVSPEPREIMSVRTAEDIDKALGDDGNEHHCPLCGELFGNQAFIAHAAQCIEARAPRHKVWVPAGIEGALAAFPEKRGGA